MKKLKPLECCADAARAQGKPPALKLLCQSCADYRHYLEDIRYRPHFMAGADPEVVGAAQAIDEAPDADAQAAMPW